MLKQGYLLNWDSLVCPNSGLNITESPWITHSRVPTKFVNDIKLPTVPHAQRQCPWFRVYLYKVLRYVKLYLHGHNSCKYLMHELMDVDLSIVGTSWLAAFPS